MHFIPIAIYIVTILIGASQALPRTFINNPSRPNVVGGVEAEKSEFPWIIGIRRPYHGCAGTIINSEWVVSAAHCTQGDPSTYQLVGGDHDNEEPEASEQRRNVTQIVNHPDYKSYSNDFDISLIQVYPPFEFNEFVQPIPLAPSGFIPTDWATVSGWGRIEDGGTFPTVLMKVDVPYVTDEKCRETYGESRIKDSMLCYGKEGKDGCKGDSGGPLICDDGDRKILCGIVSFGTGCATAEFPGVYSEVAFYEDFFTSVISNQ